MPMNQSRAEFSDLDATSKYEVSVGTSSLSGNASGPGMIITLWVGSREELAGDAWGGGVGGKLKGMGGS